MPPDSVIGAQVGARVSAPELASVIPGAGVKAATHPLQVAVIIIIIIIILIIVIITCRGLSPSTRDRDSQSSPGKVYPRDTLRCHSPRR